MTEKHPTGNDSKSQEPVPQTAQDKLSHMIKDTMTPSDWREYVKYIAENELSDVSIPLSSPKNTVSFLRFARACSEESDNFDVYAIIRMIIEKQLTTDVKAYVGLNDSDCRDLMHELQSYLALRQKYTDTLHDRIEAILSIADAIDLIDDPVVRNTVNQKCIDLLDVHEVIALYQYSMEEQHLKLEIEKLKYSQKKSNAPNVLFDKITEISNNITTFHDFLGDVVKSVFNQEQKLDQLHELSKESLIGQREIKGELPPGGIRQLKKLLHENPEQLAKRYAERFSKVTSQLTPAQWKVYSLHRDGESNAKIAKALGYSHPHIGNMLKEIDMVFRANELPSGITFYVQQKRVPSYFLDDDNKEELSSRGNANDEDRYD